jgi:predicted Zn-dependent protease
MKKAILMFAVMGLAFHGVAQEKYVVSALTALKSNNFDEAKESIDKAMANPDSKEKPKTLFAKGAVYSQLQDVEKYKSQSPYKESLQALFKLVEVKADYERESVDQLLLRDGTLAFNDAVKAYNDKKYAEAVETMKLFSKIHDLEGGKRFAKIKSLDTNFADANLSIANGLYYGGNFAEAIPALQKVKSERIRMSPSIYECLITAYKGQKDNANALAMIEESRKAYPSDMILRNYELNYYIETGKTDDLAKKLEEAAKSEPNNSDIQFNLATTYLTMAQGKDGKKPANSAEMLTKAEGAFQSATKISPDNATFNFNFGALYFNQATEMNDQMNALGTSKADMAKYDQLKGQRDGLFGKALPYLEKAYGSYSSQGADVRAEDQRSYKNTLIALNKIYAIQSKMDKATEMNKKLDAMK